MTAAGSPPTVLISGGAGFIGSRLAHAASAKGCKVVCLDNLHPQVHPIAEWPDGLESAADLRVADVTDGEAWERALAEVRPDVVVHLAAETATGQSLFTATRHGQVNVVGTTQLLDACHRSGHFPGHLVLASSRAIYGEGAWRTEDGEVFLPDQRNETDLAAGRFDPESPDGTSAAPIPSVAELTMPRPVSVYAATKLAQEHLMRAWCEALAPSLTILRLQNAYGPGQSLANPYTGVIAFFAQLALRGEPIPVYEDGRILRDFVHVDDVVQALTLAIERPPNNLRVVDIGSGDARTIFEAAQILAGLADAPDPVVTGQFRAGDVRAASCDLGPAQRELGFEPHWRLNDGLADVLAWVRAQVS